MFDYVYWCTMYIVTKLTLNSDVTFPTFLKYETEGRGISGGESSIIISYRLQEGNALLGSCQQPFWGHPVTLIWYLDVFLDSVISYLSGLLYKDLIGL